MRTQRRDRSFAHLANSKETFLLLADKARTFDERAAAALIAERDYEALDQDEKTINVHVSHLRDKIEDDPAAPAFVLTVRGVGYAFAER